MELRQTLNYLFEQNTLTQEEAKQALTNIGKGEFTESEIAAFLTVFCMRKITPAELAGFREALLGLCVPVDLSAYNAIDVCGTGGDEKNTFNISTLTAFVIAGAGYKVVKHGNYGVSSGCGSSNVLEHLGYKFSNDLSKINKEIEEANICYLHAPFFHPAMKYVAPVRKSLKVKTFFNLLGPMVNPSRPNNQIVGVFNTEVQELYSEVYKKLGINYHIIYALDGYDEISLTGDFRVISDKGDKTFSPTDLCLPTVKAETLHGGASIPEAAEIFTRVIKGEGSEAQTSAVLANAAFGIQCFEKDKSLTECVEIAKESINSGKAYNALEALLKLQ